MHPLDFMFCCLVEVEDSIGVKRLFLGISSYLSGKCFVSKLVFCCRSRREQNLQMCIKVVWKDPHFHQQFHFMYVFSCFPRFAFFYIERIWKGTVNNSVIQWHFHDINIFFFLLDWELGSYFKLFVDYYGLSEYPKIQISFLFCFVINFRGLIADFIVQ